MLATIISGIRRSRWSCHWLSKSPGSSPLRRRAAKQPWKPDTDFHKPPPTARTSSGGFRQCCHRARKKLRKVAIRSNPLATQLSWSATATQTTSCGTRLSTSAKRCVHWISCRLLALYMYRYPHPLTQIHVISCHVVNKMIISGHICYQLLLKTRHSCVRRQP